MSEKRSCPQSKPEPAARIQAASADLAAGPLLVGSGADRARPGGSGSGDRPAWARPLRLQAAIASLHADQPPDWSQIGALYGELSRATGSPVVELSRAVAIAEAEGPDPLWSEL